VTCLNDGRSATTDDEECREPYHCRTVDTLLAPPVRGKWRVDETNSVPDMQNFSTRTPLELLFGFDQSSITDFACAYGDWAHLRLPKDMVRMKDMKDQLLPMTVLAAATQYLARTRNDPNLLSISYEVQHRALQSLQQRLGDKNRRPEADALVLSIANTAILTAETMNGAADDVPVIGFPQASLAAAIRLLHRAGPVQFRSKLGLAVLRSFRSKSHFFRLRSGEPCLFSTVEWLSEPYAIEGKTHLDELYDIIDHLVDVHWRMRRFMHAHSIDDPEHEFSDRFAAMEVWYAIVEAQQTLKTWLATSQRKHAKALFTAVPTSSLWPLAGSMQSTTLNFASADIATMMHLYWFYDFMMTSTAYKFQFYLLSTFAGNILSTPPLTLHDLDASVLRICHAIEYPILHLEHLGTPLTWFTFVTLRFAMLHFAEYAATGSAWHESMLRWTYDTSVTAREKHFLGRKGQFVTDCVYGGVEEAVPMLFGGRVNGLMANACANGLPAPW